MRLTVPFDVAAENRLPFGNLTDHELKLPPESESQAVTSVPSLNVAMRPGFWPLMLYNTMSE
jgi:hypothetical protein